MRRTTTAVLVVLALVVLAGAACSDDGDDGAGPDSTDGAGEPVDAGALVGRTFLLSFVGAGGDPVLGTLRSLSLTFDEEQLSFRAQCNTFSGPWSVDGDVLVAGPFGGTEMGCDDARQAQDEALSVFLSSGPTIALDGDQLTVSDETDALGFTDEQVAVPDQPLEGTTWTVTSLVTGTEADGAVSSLPVGVEAPTLVIGEDGTVALFDGCNRGSTTVEVAEATLTFGLVAQTLIGCEPDVRSVADHVHGVVDEGETTYELDGDTLTLTRGDRGLVLTAG